MQCSGKVAGHQSIMKYVTSDVWDIILLVNLISFSWALINTSALFMVNMSNVVQKCPALIRKMLVSMSDVVKNVS